MYITKERIKRSTGIKPGDLNLDTDEELNATLDEWIEEATDLINEDRGRDYQKEVDSGIRDKVPAGIRSITERIVGNMISRAILRRETPIVQNEDFEINMTTDEIFTDSIKSDLARYPMKSSLNIFTVGAVDDEIESESENEF